MYLGPSIESVHVVYANLAAAQKVAAELQAGDADWFFAAYADAISGRAVIYIYDEDGEFVAMNTI